MDNRRKLLAGTLSIGGVILARETFFWVWGEILDYLRDESGHVNWADFPWINAFGIILILAGLAIFIWPSLRRLGQARAATEAYDDSKLIADITTLAAKLEYRAKAAEEGARDYTKGAVDGLKAQIAEQAAEAARFNEMLNEKLVNLEQRSVDPEKLEVLTRLANAAFDNLGPVSMKVQSFQNDFERLELGRRALLEKITKIEDIIAPIKAEQDHKTEQQRRKTALEVVGLLEWFSTPSEDAPTILPPVPHQKEAEKLRLGLESLGITPEDQAKIDAKSEALIAKRRHDWLQGNNWRELRDFQLYQEKCRAMIQFIKRREGIL